MKTIEQSTSDDLEKASGLYTRIEFRKNPELAKALDTFEELQKEFYSITHRNIPKVIKE